MKAVYVFAKWQVSEGQLDTVLTLLREVARLSRLEPGNIIYSLHQSNTDPNTLMIYEGYKDAAAAAAHRESEHFQTLVNGKIAPLLAAREPIVASLLDI